MKDRYHSNSLFGGQMKDTEWWSGRLPAAFREEVVSAIDVDHAVFEGGLPLVLDTLHLKKRVSLRSVVSTP